MGIFGNRAEKEAFLHIDDLGRNGNVYGLVSYLLNKNSRIRSMASSVLVMQEDKGANPFLFPLLENSDEWVRRCAISALGFQGNTPAVGHLRKYLYSKEAKWVFISLCKIGDPTVLDDLIKFMKAGIEYSNVNMLGGALMEGNIEGDGIVNFIITELNDHLKDRNMRTSFVPPTTWARDQELELPGWCDKLKQLDWQPDNSKCGFFFCLNTRNDKLKQFDSEYLTPVIKDLLSQSFCSSDEPNVLCEMAFEAAETLGWIYRDIPLSAGQRELIEKNICKDVWTERRRTTEDYEDAERSYSAKVIVTQKFCLGYFLKEPLLRTDADIETHYIR